MAARDDDDEWAPDTSVESLGAPVAPITSAATKRHTAPGGYHIGSIAPPAGPRGQTPSARAAFAKIQELSNKFDAHSQADKEALGKIDQRLDDQGRSLVANATAVAGLKGSVDTLVEELRHRRELERVEIQGEVTAQVEKQKTERARIGARARVWIALIGSGAGLGALVKWLVDRAG